VSRQTLIIVGAVVVLVVVGGTLGGLAASGTFSSGAPRITAYYMAPNGDDGNSGSSSSPFLTANKCYTTASPGDTCYMLNGTYSPRYASVNAPDKTSGACDGYTINGDTSGCVTFRPQNPGQVTISSADYWHCCSNYTRFQGVTAYDLYWFHNNPGECNSLMSNVILDGMTLHYVNVQDFDHVGILNSTVGQPAVKGTVVQIGECGSASKATNLRFDGDTIQNAVEDCNRYTSSCDPHLECVQNQSAYTSYVTLRNSRILNCAEFDMNWGTNHFLMENNFLAATCSEQALLVQNDPTKFCETGAALLTGCAGAGGEGNYTIRFNVFNDAVTQSSGNCSYVGTNLVYGNIFYRWGMSQAICSDLTNNFKWTFSYNIYDAGAYPCGSGSVAQGQNTVQLSVPAGGPLYNFHLSSCTVAAANLVPVNVAGGYPSTDFAGNPRGGNALDAGAYEDCASGTSPPPPPPPPPPPIPPTTTPPTTSTPPAPSVTLRITERLSYFHTTIQTATLYKTWKKQNPNEAGKAEAYWANGALPVPQLATAFGKSYVAAAEAYHYAAGDHT